jgi:hypothetical protein
MLIPRTAAESEPHGKAAGSRRGNFTQNFELLQLLSLAALVVAHLDFDGQAVNRPERLSRLPVAQHHIDGGPRQIGRRNIALDRIGLTGATGAEARHRQANYLAMTMHSYPDAGHAVTTGH